MSLWLACGKQAEGQGQGALALRRAPTSVGTRSGVEAKGSLTLQQVQGQKNLRFFDPFDKLRVKELKLFDKLRSPLKSVSR